MTEVIEEKKLTCTVCPVGCHITVTMKKDADDPQAKPEIVKVEGNTCPRGAKYASSEMTNPVRTLTSAVKISGVSERIPDLKMLPVKTDKPIPKGKMFEAMKIIKSLSVNPGINTGDTVYKDFIEKGTDLVASRSI